MPSPMEVEAALGRANGRTFVPAAGAQWARDARVLAAEVTRLSAPDREKIEAAIKDAYYHARDNGGTMHTAAVDATDAVLALLAPTRGEEPGPRTSDEIRDFAHAWDRRVEEGWARNGKPPAAGSSR